VRESKRTSRRSNAWPHTRVTPRSYQCRETSCRSFLETLADSPHASPLSRPTTLGSSHTVPAARARITIRRDIIRRRASPLLLPTARMTARAWSRTRRRRRRHEAQTRFDATRLPGGSCEHNARRYPRFAKPLPADGASGLSAAASAPKIPTLRRVLVECDRLALLQVITNASADGALRFLVVDEITTQIDRLVASARREKRLH
jgi:hypothetical protein